MFNWFAHIGHISLRFFSHLGRSMLLFFQTIGYFHKVLARPRLIIQQTFSVGVRSMLIIIVSGFFVGMVLGLQGYNTLVDFGAEESLGIVVALSLVRELGPVVTALLYAGRAGSALTAEIGLMKATEQLSGLEMMAVNPVERILAPRLLAGIISMPLLAAMFSAVGIFGGYLIGVEMLGVDTGAYWSQMQAKVDFNEDILNGVIKSVIFGIVTTWIAVYEGYNCIPTSEGVSSATTRTVVNSALTVLALDFLLTAIML